MSNTVRSSHRRCSIKKGVLKNFAKFTGKHIRRSNFFNELQDGGKKDSAEGAFLFFTKYPRVTASVLSKNRFQSYQ